MKIDELKPARGSRRRRRRRGRGWGSGRGAYSGRGRKGQSARSGAGPRPGFEGGQTILTKRLPFRRGVRAGGVSHAGGLRRLKYAPVNLKALNRFPADTEVTPRQLLEARLIKRGPVKILGTGALDRPLTIKAHAFSKTAMAAIEKAGGRAEAVFSLATSYFCCEQGHAGEGEARRGLRYDGPCRRVKGERRDAERCWKRGTNAPLSLRRSRVLHLSTILASFILRTFLVSYSGVLENLGKAFKLAYAKPLRCIA